MARDYLQPFVTGKIKGVKMCPLILARFLTSVILIPIRGRSVGLKRARRSPCIEFDILSAHGRMFLVPEESKKN